MTKILKETVKSLITNGKPHQDTLDAIDEEGFTILRTLPVNELQPQYGFDTDYITFYVKTELIEDSMTPVLDLPIQKDNYLMDRLQVEMFAAFGVPKSILNANITTPIPTLVQTK